MKESSKYIDFYRKCYRADNRDLSIWNVFKTDNCYFLDGGLEELATASMPRIPVPYKVGEILFKKQKTHKREKNLVYGVLFVAGKLGGLSGFITERTVCSPLIYYDADIIIDDGNYYFKIDLDNPHLNTPLLAEIVSDEKNKASRQDFSLISGPVDNLYLGDVISWLANNSIVNDVTELVRYPKLNNKKDAKHLVDTKKSLYAMSSAALVLVDRPKASRGILHELKLLSSAGDYSLPLRKLFGQHNEKNVDGNIDVDNIPGLLSRSQVGSLDIASKYALGLVTGPPGTGKSYTIAAIALDRLLQGESVLIVSETDQSIDVINEKLARDFNAEDIVLRAGTKLFLKKLKNSLDNWLKFGVDHVQNSDLRKLHSRLKLSKKIIIKREREFIKRINHSTRWGISLSNINNKLKLSLIGSIKQYYIHWRIKNSQLPWDQVEAIRRLLKKRNKYAADYLKLHMHMRVEQLLKKNRRELSKFNMAIRARNSQKQLSLHSEIDYSHIFKAFPVWLASLDIVHHVLPLKKDLFDLVIIDEATQCNIASVLPVLQRAKRVLVVGDSKQLKHVSFLPYKKEKEIYINSGLDSEEYEQYSYRRNSILDLVSNSIDTQSAVVMLDEHYRSKPDLIAFSNQRFYDGRLKVMQHRPNEYMKGNIIVRRLAGLRDSRGVNRQEGQAVIDHVKSMIKQYARQRPKPSIGILSPYREQVNYLQKLLLKQVSFNDIENHMIRVATPYGFQGDEKDYMLISMSIDDDSRRAAAYLNREDMFNVAITRARQGKFIFISSDYRLLPSSNLFREYMESLDNFDDSYLPVSEELDGFQDEVCEVLNECGIATWKSYPVAGRNVDILCCSGSKSVALDLIGFPGEYEEFYEMTTYDLFSRAGLEVFPLSYGLWLMNKNACISAIKNRFN
jgi:superfamily I DNA and/or RNA helicase